FQAEDGIRYFHVTGVQTCALPIYAPRPAGFAPGPPFGLASHRPTRSRSPKGRWNPLRRDPLRRDPPASPSRCDGWYVRCVTGWRRRVVETGGSYRASPGVARSGRPRCADRPHELVLVDCAQLHSGRRLGPQWTEMAERGTVVACPI